MLCTSSLLRERARSARVSASILARLPGRTGKQAEAVEQACTRGSSAFSVGHELDLQKSQVAEGQRRDEGRGRGGEAARDADNKVRMMDMMTRQAAGSWQTHVLYCAVPCISSHVFARKFMKPCFHQCHTSAGSAALIMAEDRRLFIALSGLKTRF